MEAKDFCRSETARPTAILRITEPLKPVNTALLAAHGLHQVKAGLRRIVTATKYESEVEGGLEVMTGIELFFSNHIGRLIGFSPCMVTTWTIRSVGFIPNFSFSQWKEFSTFAGFAFG